MPFPSPDDYSDWKPYVKALIAAIDGGALVELIKADPYASGTIAAEISTGVAAGFSPVWLNDDDALLYLGQSTIPPTAGSLFEVDTANLAAASVTFNEIADGAVGTNHVQNLAITTALIADAAVLTAKIGDLQVVTAKIADLAVNDAKIANLAVTSAKIANLAVGTAQIDNLSVTNGKLGLLSVGTANIIDANITTAKIGDLQVTNAKMALLSVGTANIIDLSVTQAKIGLLAVGAAQIDNLAVTSAKIANLAVTKVKIGDYEIDAQKLESLAISEAGVISTASSMTVSSGSYVDLAPGGLTIELDVDVPNITGDQMVLIFITIEAGAAAATQGRVRIARDGTATILDPISAKMAVGTTDETHTFLFADDTPVAGSTHTYTAQVLQNGGNWSARNTVFTTRIFKR